MQMVNFNLNSLIRTQDTWTLVSKAVKIGGNFTIFDSDQVYKDIIRATSGKTANTPV